MKISAYALFAVLLLFGAIAVAQQQPAAQSQSQPEATAPTATQAAASGSGPETHSNAAPVDGAGSIRLDVLVTDKAGKVVPGLEPNDFTLMDNGQPVKIVSARSIDTTAPNAEMPVETILVFDLVNRDYQQLAAEREEADKFFHRNGGKLAHPVSIYVFTEKGLSALPVSSAQGEVMAEELKKVDAQLRVINHSQAYYGYPPIAKCAMDWLPTHRKVRDGLVTHPSQSARWMGH